MNDDYNIDQLEEQFSCFEQECVLWLGDVCKFMIYNRDKEYEIADFPDYGDLAEEVRVRKDVKVYNAMKEELDSFRKELNDRVVNIISELKVSEEPDVKSYEKLLFTFNSLISYLYELRASVREKDNDLDSVTGMKNQACFYREIQRDMSRLERGDNCFVFVLMKLNRFSDIRLHSNDSDFDAMLSRVAEIVGQCIRLHDDCYVMNGNYFLVCARITDIYGGKVIADRIRKKINNEKMLVQINKDKRDYLSVSEVVARPETGQKIRILLENILYVLDKTEDDTVSIYTEKTDIEKYVKSEFDDGDLLFIDEQKMQATENQQN